MLARPSQLKPKKNSHSHFASVSEVSSPGSSALSALSKPVVKKSPLLNIDALKVPNSPKSSFSRGSIIQSPVHMIVSSSFQPVIDPLFKIRRILKNENRTSEEVLFLYQFLRDSKFFKDFRENNSGLHETDALLHACRNVGFEWMPPGKVIFEEGQTNNDKMYLILSGEVSIRTKKSDAYIPLNKPDRKNSINIASGISISPFKRRGTIMTSSRNSTPLKKD